MDAPTERLRPFTPAEHLAIHADAAQAHLQRLLTATQWAVAALHLEGHRPRIAALNTYDRLADAVRVYEELAAEMGHEHVTLTPVGPLTPGELAAAEVSGSRS